MFKLFSKIIVSLGIFISSVFSSHQTATILVPPATTTPTATITATPLIIKTKKNIEVKISSSPTTRPPSPTQAPNTPHSSKEDVANLVSVIDEVTFDLADDMAQMSQLVNTMNSNYQEFSPYLNATQAGLWQKIILDIESQFVDVLSPEISSYQKALLAERQQVLSSGYVDDNYWRNIRIPDMVNHQKRYKQKLVDATSTFSQSLMTIKNNIHNNLNPPSTPAPVIQAPQQPVADPAQMYKDCANEQEKAKQEVLAGFSAGGFATQSQIDGMTVNKMKSDGFGYCFYLR